MADESEVICANTDCRVSEDGRCIEGFEIAACPHYGRQLEDSIDSNQESYNEVEDSTNVALPSADTLTADEMSALLCANDSRVIAIVGPSDSGKTSLIACIYDLFQVGPVAEASYAHSLTLHAFEHTCHDARAASRRQVPHTIRTPRGEVRFYHLDLNGGAAGQKLTLALGDRAGEEYKEAADDASVVQGFPELMRADAITMLVDGHRLLDSAARHNLRSEISMILQAFVDGGCTRIGQQLALVLTKIDAIQVSPSRERAEADYIALVDHIANFFGGHFSKIESFRISASPRTDPAFRGSGVPELLKFWLSPIPQIALSPRIKQRPVRAFARLFPFEA